MERRRSGSSAFDPFEFSPARLGAWPLAGSFLSAPMRTPLSNPKLAGRSAEEEPNGKVLEEPASSSRAAVAVVVSAGGGSVVVSAGGGSVVVSAGGGSVVVSAGGGSVVVSAGGGSVVVSAGGGSVVVSAGGASVVSSGELSADVADASLVVVATRVSPACPTPAKAPARMRAARATPRRARGAECLLWLMTCPG
jgi:hypothetical protein